MICPNCKKRSLSVASSRPEHSQSSIKAYTYMGQERWTEMELCVCSGCGYSRWVKTRTVNSGYQPEHEPCERRM